MPLVLSAIWKVRRMRFDLSSRNSTLTTFPLRITSFCSSPPVLVPLALPPVLVLPVPGWDADWQAFL